jgi:hypothetical protein
MAVDEPVYRAPSGRGVPKVSDVPDQILVLIQKEAAESRHLVFDIEKLILDPARSTSAPRFSCTLYRSLEIQTRRRDRRNRLTVSTGGGCEDERCLRRLHTRTKTCGCVGGAPW